MGSLYDDVGHHHRRIAADTEPMPLGQHQADCAAIRARMRQLASREAVPPEERPPSPGDPGALAVLALLLAVIMLAAASW